MAEAMEKKFEVPKRILFVCTGNICRSPTALGVAQSKFAKSKLTDCVVLDGAGTHDYHIGDTPDDRSIHHAKLRGYDLSKLRARQVCAADFNKFDLILCADQANVSALKHHAPKKHNAHVKYLLEFADEDVRKKHGLIVPDPYYGEADGFELVLDLVENAVDGLVRSVNRSRTADDAAAEAKL